jgi:hypothetical protein
MLLGDMAALYSQAIQPIHERRLSSSTGPTTPIKKGRSSIPV